MEKIGEEAEEKRTVRGDRGCEAVGREHPEREKWTSEKWEGIEEGRNKWKGNIRRV